MKNVMNKTREICKKITKLIGYWVLPFMTYIVINAMDNIYGNDILVILTIGLCGFVTYSMSKILNKF